MLEESCSLTISCDLIQVRSSAFTTCRSDDAVARPLKGGCGMQDESAVPLLDVRFSLIRLSDVLLPFALRYFL